MTNRFFRPLFWPTLLTALMLPVLLALGFWQLERLQWKEDLLARIENRLTAAPADLPPPQAWADFDVAAQEYSRVRLTGRFASPRELHYFMQGPDGTPGYAVINAFEVEGGEGAVVLVDRGFVPAGLKDPALRDALPEGQVSFTGILRQPQRRNALSGADDPDKNVWMVRDTETMGAALGAAQVAPFFVEAEEAAFPGKWPQAGATRIEMPNNHLDYALTWFGLALVLVAVYLVYHRSNGRLGRPKT
ncbi:Surfeit locus 1 family protein [Parvibaculum lavamentivorans DS-1]|uniref:SURF1-like protein n=1 Tax=Parvibaculum lavamentivorans (strain DS-1 / DSM 13023 / NCIMB 13966) TaxID=402881 RepID=A7HQW5_PARL1|nr:SURF1 family protein [Parvibaculum lavamentivorans]ABS62298.1 Surfeit locus 1 family protein [Parvibaculum lavamentivorans DS-1]